MSDSSSPIVGIDLGTTNSVVAAVINGKPQVLQCDDSPSLSFGGRDRAGRIADHRPPSTKPTGGVSRSDHRVDQAENGNNGSVNDGG